MAKFSEAEIRYLTEERLLGRIATIGKDGRPHVVPVGWRYEPERQTILVTGRNFADTQKYLNARRNPNVSIIVDDVLPPWRPRSVLVQGRAELVDEGGDTQAAIRIVPEKVISWGLPQVSQTQASEGKSD